MITATDKVNFLIASTKIVKGISMLLNKDMLELLVLKTERQRIFNSAPKDFPDISVKDQRDNIKRSTLYNKRRASKYSFASSF